MGGGQWAAGKPHSYNRKMCPAVTYTLGAVGITNEETDKPRKVSWEGLLELSPKEVFR